ncbi:MAG: T9SS type A sorting domain-containing protein, partial [Flavobacteriales bacterium]
DYVTITSDFSIRFIASDSLRLGQYLDGGSLVEAAVDDVYLYDATNINSLTELNIVLEVYPNPSKGVVVFCLEEDAFVKVINTLGEIIMETQLSISDNKIDLSAYNKGIYYLEIISKKQKITKKIVLE